MRQTVLKNQVDTEKSKNNTWHHDQKKHVKKDTHFDVEIVQKNYPSCYRYNVLIMLAKRLIKKQEEKEYICKNRWCLDKKLAARITSA